MSLYIFFRRLRLLLCSTCFPPTHHVIVACGLAPIASHLIWWDFPADKVFPWSRSFTTEGPSESRKWQIHHPSLKKYVVLCSRNSRKQMWKTNACCKMFERVKKKSMKQPINMAPTPKIFGIQNSHFTKHVSRAHLEITTAT